MFETLLIVWSTFVIYLGALAIWVIRQATGREIVAYRVVR